MDFYETTRQSILQGGRLLPSLPPNLWNKVNLNGQPVATLTDFGFGRTGGVAWAFFTFQEDATGAVNTLWWQDDASGNLQISLADGPRSDANKGTVMTTPSVLLRPIVEDVHLRVSIWLDFTDSSGTATQYRFDSKSWS